MKKWMYLVIACLSITLIGYSVMAYANETPASASKEVKGIFVAVDGQSHIQIQTTNGTETITLAKSVWVYRNQQKANLTDLKAKDQLEVILNGKQQAAYIKAHSLDAAASAAPSPTPEPTTAPTPTPEPAATATPDSTATSVPAAPESSAEVIAKTQAQLTVTLNSSKKATQGQAGNHNNNDDHDDDNDPDDDKKHDDNKRGKAFKKSDHHGENHGHRSGDD